MGTVVDMFRPNLLGVAASVLVVAGFGTAHSPVFAQAPKQEATAVMSSLAVLQAKDEIQEQMARYTILLDGDGFGTQVDAWAKYLFTSNATLRTVGESGEPGSNFSGGLRGRKQIAKAFARTNDGTRVYRVYPVNTAFDEVTPTRIRTRTGAVVWNGAGTSTQIRAQSPSQVVFHDVWVREDGLWKKQSSELRYLTKGFAESEAAPQPRMVGSDPRARDPRVRVRHFPIAMVVDELTPTTAKTRTALIIMSGQRNSGDVNVPLRNSAFFIYKDTWRKEVGKWKKVDSVLHYTTYNESLPDIPGGGEDTIASRGPIYAKAGTGMSELDILTAKAAIRSQWADYTLINDGDGLPNCGTDRWGPALFTRDGTFQSVGPGMRKNHGPRGYDGLDEISTRFGGGQVPFPPCEGDRIVNPKNVPELTGLDALIVRDQIREGNAQFALLLDADNAGGPDVRVWSERLFLPNATFQSETYDLRLLYGPGSGLQGRSAIAAKFENSTDPALVGNWYLANIAFDLLAKDEVRTRTTAFYVTGPNGTKASVSALAPIVAVIHTAWQRTPQGWMIASITIR